MKGAVLILSVLCLAVAGCLQQAAVLKPGLITDSGSFRPAIYHFVAESSMDTAIITISGHDLVLDFGGLVMDGTLENSTPDTYKGIAIRIVDSKNITIRNLTIRGYKIGLYAENTDNLMIEDSDFSYNYRQRLGSKWDREALSDWLYYHDNENDEWFRYGAAVYLKDCDQATVRNIRVTQGQNGLMLVGCNHGLFYNNDMSYNSGLGIGMYRSSDNRIMHNRLDWNVRGYSHGQYARGQDSAGILLYEQCNRNTIAFNSATHSGDGLFLWAGNHTMDTGEGGCNDNIIFKNDFSHSVANGVEVTFSSNIIVDNILDDSRYGIWGGYSHHSYISGNHIDGCDFGIAIEHGNHNTIVGNVIENCDVGIQLWERSSPPSGWGFAEKRDVTSRVYQIIDNDFVTVGKALEISGTDSAVIAGNRYRDVQEQLIANTPNPGLQINATDADPAAFAPPIDLPEPLPDGINAMLPHETLRGRQYMIVDEWGPYNFAYPIACLRRIDGDLRFFSLFGPHGNFKLTSAQGFDMANPKSGSLPLALEVHRIPDSSDLQLEFVFIGNRFIDQFGDTVVQGQEFEFDYHDYDPLLQWEMVFYRFDETNTPLGDNSLFDDLDAQRPLSTLHVDRMAFRWWGEPVSGVPADGFVTVAQTVFTCTPGTYRIQTESDDGIRVYVDDHLVIDHWDVHTPAIDTTTIKMGGTHQIRILHFENTGLATLDFSIEPVKD